MSLASQFSLPITFLSWAVLPNLATSFIQSLYYGITIRAGDRKPRPGEAKYVKHYRWIKIAVVIVYLLYQIYETDWNIRRAGDYYQALGVSHTIDDRGIKSRFRRLAALYHPDKVSSSNPSAEANFVQLKHAQDTLMDPVKRAAYDKFGPTILECKRCASIREYIDHGVWFGPGQAIFFRHAATAVGMYIAGMMGYLQWGQWWRWFIFCSVCVFELHSITRPYPQTIAANIVNPAILHITKHPPFLPFQLVTLVRSMAYTLYTAFSHIGPLLESPEAQRMQADPELSLKQSLERLEKMTVKADMQARDLLLLEMVPYTGNHQALSEMKVKAKDFIVNNTINLDPEVRDARGNLIERRRLNVPAGARGNR